MPSDRTGVREKLREHVEHFDSPGFEEITMPLRVDEARTLLAALDAAEAERDRLKEVLEYLADDDGYCDFVSIARNAIATPTETPE